MLMPAFKFNLRNLARGVGAAMRSGGRASPDVGVRDSRRRHRRRPRGRCTERKAQQPQEPDRLIVHEIDVTCPIDGQSFKAPMISAYAMRAVRLDLKPMGP